ncbi:Uncharacterised protein r2_g624 [Pycnogonum litorale]
MSDSDLDIVDYFKNFVVKDADINSWVLDKLEMFKFLGFNARKTGEALFRIAGSYETLSINLEDFCCLIIMRGTKIGKARTRISPRGLEALEMIREKYNILDVVKKEDDITLARVSIVAAPMISSILQRKLGRFIIPPGRFGEDFPPGLAFPSSLTIIPNTKEWQNTIDTVKQWCFCFNRLIKSKSRLTQWKDTDNNKKFFCLFSTSYFELLATGLSNNRYKVEGFLLQACEQFQKCYYPFECVSIDETMVKFSWRTRYLQYIFQRNLQNGE